MDLSSEHLYNLSRMLAIERHEPWAVRHQAYLLGQLWRLIDGRKMKRRCMCDDSAAVPIYAKSP